LGVLPARIDRAFDSGFHYGRTDGWRDALDYMGRQTTEYHFYMTFGTLSTLYASLHMMTHSNHSYAYFHRRNTFNIDQKPGHVRHMFAGDTNIAPQRSAEEVLNMARSRIRGIEEAASADRLPRFHILVEDQFMLMAFNALLSVGIPEDRYRITILSAGAGDFYIDYSPWGADSIARWGNLTWAQHRDAFEYILARYRENHTATVNNHSLASSWIYNTRFQLIAAQRPNVQFYMQFPEFFLLQPGLSPTVQGELMRSRLVKMQPIDILNRLSAPSQQLFFDAYLNNPNNTFDGQPVTRALLDSFLLREAGQKPVLIVSGTTTGNIPGEGTVFPQPAMFQQIIDHFGDRFEIMFKPHPVGPPFGELLTWLNNNNIRVLPPQIPMEVLMWAYPDSFIGGYNSSLYAAVTGSQVLFFVGGLTGAMYFIDNLGFFNYVEARFSA